MSPNGRSSSKAWKNQYHHARVEPERDFLWPSFRRSPVISARVRKQGWCMQGLRNGLSGSKLITWLWWSPRAPSAVDPDTHRSANGNGLNPFMPIAAKYNLTILEIFFSQGHILVKVWMRNVLQKSIHNFRSNILWSFASFPSYLQKYESSRRYFLKGV